MSCVCGAPSIDGGSLERTGKDGKNRTNERTNERKIQQEKKKEKGK